MKTLITAFLFSFAVAGQSATVNLNVGDVITLQPGSLTTVTCGGFESKCQVAIKNLQTRLAYCKKPVNTPVSYCIQEIWPTFKQQNPQCVDEAFQSCMSFCKQDTFEINCLELCE